MPSSGSPLHADLPEPLLRAVRDELADGETIRWAGQPRPSRYAVRAIPMVIFGLSMAGSTWLWMGGLVGGSDPAPLPFDIFESVMKLAGLPFVVVALAMLASPLWMIWKARRTVYAVTDRRGIAITLGVSMKVDSFDGDQLAGLKRKQREDGSGDIELIPASPRDVVHPERSIAGSSGTCFYGVNDVRGAEEHLRALMGSQE